METVYIIQAKRTPIGSFGKALQSLSAVDLGEIAINSLFNENTALKQEVTEIYIGNVFKSGIKGNPARQLAIRTELPISTVAMTLDMQCASGMAAFIQGANRIQLGEADLVVVGGIESMTNVPHLMMDARWGKRIGNPKIVDALMHDGLICAIEDYHMGITAENLVQKYGLTRETQDEYALQSQQRALMAIQENRFTREIVPVAMKLRGKEVIFNQDEHPKDTSLEHLAKLSPAFAEGGTVTAGNASGLNDGAAAILLASEQAVQRLGLKPLAKVVSTASHGVQPSIMGIGPVPAMLKALDKVDLSMDEMDLVEINEAFAAQVLAVNTELNIPNEKLNVNGGAIALGHPVGASGIRVIVTLLHELQRQSLSKGIASLCVGGGLGAATIIELV
ncbi:thiolase family protein [Solibacillus sp. FSL K6-1523]|uniref:thiolase family protein n=1 Tax=Solibacillus sp. FSL K6-1523 TaxID=2921471 RepID=UPI0030FC972A